MTVPQPLILPDDLSVALPAYIHQPVLRQLAERMQYEMLAQTLHGDAEHYSQSARILERLYQTPIADASVLVAITNEARPKLLLTRRAAHMNSHAGEVSCAGGKHERYDGNNVITALREACEETALPPNKVQLLGQLPIQTSKSGMSVRPIVALIEPNLQLVLSLIHI